MWLEWELLEGDTALEELSGPDDADELCRLLLESQWGWGSSSRYSEAVELLEKVRGTGTLPPALLALLLCTCGRWGRVTAQLIAAIEGSGMLSEADLDELAESLLTESVVVVYPYLWAHRQGLNFETTGYEGPAVTITESTIGESQRHPEPPLCRWGAGRVLRNDPGRLDELLAAAEGLPKLHRDALIHGLLDAASVLEGEDRRRLIRRGLRSGIRRVRRTALDRLCELDGPQTARQRAHADADRKVRAWRPPATTQA